MLLRIIFATNIKYDDYGKGIFDLLIDGKYVDAISLNVVGIHNISNSLPSIALANYFSIPIDVIKRGFSPIQVQNEDLSIKVKFVV